MKRMIRMAISCYRSSLLPQFISLAVVTSILFVLVSQLITSNYFHSSLHQVIDAVESDTIVMQAQNIERYVHDEVTRVYEIVIDREIYSAVDELWNSQASQRAMLSLKLRQLIEDYADDNVECITVVLPNRQVVFYSRLYGTWVGLPWLSNQLLAAGNDNELFALYDQTMASRELTVWLRPNYYKPTETYLFHLSYPVIDLLTKESIGVVIVTFNTDALRAMVNPLVKDSDTIGLSYNILTGRDGTILAHPDETKIGQKLCPEDTDEEDQIEDQVYFTKADYVINRPIGRLGLQLYSVTDKGITTRQARGYTSSLFIIISAITLLQLAVFYGMLRRMMRSIRALQKGLETVQGGQLDVYVETREQHEVAQSIHAFNDMAVRLKQAEQQSQEQSKRTIEALERQRIAEIKTLENQINSHFLYNTLNSINYTAIRDGNLMVSRQIKHLAQVLRYTFERSDGQVTVAQEADWLKEYLMLQKLRFGHMFDLSIQVDRAVRDWPMRKLIIQPFVENSILHGFEGYTYGRLLTIHFSLFDEDRMRITIRDNGHGMPKEKLKILQERFQNCGPIGEICGIGIENACQRICSYYGGNARIYLRSWVEVGTTVVLILPRLLKTDSGVQEEPPAIEDR